MAGDCGLYDKDDQGCPWPGPSWELNAVFWRFFGFGELVRRYWWSNRSIGAYSDCLAI